MGTNLTEIRYDKVDAYHEYVRSAPCLRLSNHKTVL